MKHPRSFVLYALLLVLSAVGIAEPKALKTVAQQLYFCCGGPGPICPGSPQCPVVTSQH